MVGDAGHKVTIFSLVLHGNSIKCIKLSFAYCIFINAAQFAMMHRALKPASLFSRSAGMNLAWTVLSSLAETYAKARMGNYIIICRNSIILHC